MKFQLYKMLRLLLLLLVVLACSVTRNTNKPGHQSNYSIDSLIDFDAQKDTAFAQVIESYKSQLDGEMNAIISVSDEEMVVGKPESKLSNFITDAMLAIGKDYCLENKLNHSVDFVIMNLGGIRTGMPKGEITNGRMFEMLPFKNKLVIVGMKGTDVITLLNQIAAVGGEGISGVQMGIKENKAIAILVGGNAIDPEKIYHILSVDYLVNGGGGVTAFETRETFRHMHLKLRSEIIKYISSNYRKGINIAAKLDGRIYHVE
ncbi:hypothetical protein BZG02_04400 [Labilibaculum filiforme]|uniref:5'-Nucleotidase C-terminal domain-containing protein n=1 Tax=Labilibaculum filiforme TaxID=1940526 RepID=A0A2N3I442_9BACT|nr:5'-nucleotidase [Labilibaculum filiforme]PKQ65075.1 hypothetical protein BZG02_04400 [Labilibaculum filiforme]